MTILDDDAIGKLQNDVTDVAQRGQEHCQNLVGLMRKFHDVLAMYQRLKSDYEEEKEHREKYKKLVRDQVCFIPLICCRNIVGGETSS